jgi:hypothetical protein
MKAKVLVWLVTLALVLSAGGCGSGSGSAGAGTVAGFLGSEAYQGAKKDLQKKEQELVELYNAGVEAGEQAETLEQIEQKIRYIQYVRAALESGESAAGMDWNDPQEVGGWVGALGVLVYSVLNKRKLGITEKKYKAHKRGAAEFMKGHDKKLAEELYAAIGAERARIATG